MFEYKDKNGENDLNAECNIYVDKKTGTIHVSVLQGDMDGDSYDIYVPNHRAKILNLIGELQDVLDATDGWPQGYDGFSYSQAHAVSTGESLYDAISHGEEDGVIMWY